MQNAVADYNQYLHLEVLYQQQKAGYDWFENRDRNTRFFHSLVKGRRHKLKVSRIQNSQGDWLKDEFEIADEVVTFYQKQFKQERDSTNLSLLSHDLELVNDEDNDKLGGLPDKEEVNRAVFKLSGDSACGPDGLSGKFYQHYWDIISPDVVRMVHDFFAGNSFPK